MALTGDDLEAVPEISDLDVRDDGAVPAVDQVYILISELLTESVRQPQTLLKLPVDARHQHRLNKETQYQLAFVSTEPFHEYRTTPRVSHRLHKC